MSEKVAFGFRSVILDQPIETKHRLFQADSRNMACIKDESIHLVVTSRLIGILNDILKDRTNWATLKITDYLLTV